MASDQDRAINTFATRSFRDTADQDYIAARMAYRAELFPQFLWMAQQAIEKYLKALLCFYRIPATKIGHDIQKALELANGLPFKLNLSEAARETIDHISAYGPYRYLDVPWFITGYFLPKFDYAVWELRRYCQPIDHEALAPDGTYPPVMDAIDSQHGKPYQRFAIEGGLLEKILETKGHKARSALIWHNPCFGLKARTKFGAQWHLNASNPQLMLSPEILDTVVKLVHIPKDVQAECRTQWLPEKQKKQSSRNSIE